MHINKNIINLNIIICKMFTGNLKIKDVKSEIGQLVKSYRKQQKLSQQELADQLELSRITIQNLESGKNFTIDTLLKVFNHFDVLVVFNQFLMDKRNETEQLTSLY
jgi:transcriptional regulator with XRE-family HTH domain